MFPLYLDPQVWHEPSIFSSSLSDGSRPGCKAIGAKSLDRDLGDVHTWPHPQIPIYVDGISTNVDLVVGFGIECGWKWS